MIHHVALEIRRDDVDGAVAFWALLGFERVEPAGDLVERAVWVQRGGTQVHLLFADQPVVVPSEHVAVIAEDYEATLDRLRAAGFAPEPRREHWGSPRCHVVAPGGRRVELMASPPGA